MRAYINYEGKERLLEVVSWSRGEIGSVVFDEGESPVTVFHNDKGEHKITFEGTVLRFENLKNVYWKEK